MADIEIKDTSKKPVKILDKTAGLAEHIRSSTIRTKQQAETSVDPEESNPSEYASARMQEGASKASHEAVHGAEKIGEHSIEQTRLGIAEMRQKFYEHRQQRNAKSKPSTDSRDGQAPASDQGAEQFKRKRAKESVKKTNSSGSIRTRSSGIAVSDTGSKEIKHKSSADKKIRILKSKPVSTKGTKRLLRASKKRGVQTAARVAAQKAKKAKQAAKQAKRTAKAAKDASKRSAKAIWITARLIVRAVKRILRIIRWIIAGIFAGGWISVMVILLIGMIGLMVASSYGVFYSGEDSGTGMTMRTAVAAINEKYERNIEVQKQLYPYDELDMSGSRAAWKEVIAVYAVKQNLDPDNPQEVATMTESKQDELENVFWKMNSVKSHITTRTEKITVEEVKDGKKVKTEKEITIRTLHIVVTHKTPDEMASEYNFNSDQVEMLHELLDPKNDPLWTSMLHGIYSSYSDIVEVARDQLGNVGGEPYWSWYGFTSRVEWCCCFVSWCANECGYIERGIIPSYSVVDDGVIWFKNKGQWLDGSEEPRPGMIIFFDWADDGLGDGGDHTGIVEKVEGGRVYTIEGNSNDACREKSYPIGYYEIMGYGFYEQNNSSGTDDIASQVWTYLKSYGYSDSVAAGIIGNMMRECGGDTLDLDWDIVGHFDGDEYYGLCQWCLLYTPSDFKGASVKKQCDYLRKTIQSAFAEYGGNYGGITYSEFLKSDARTAAIAFGRVYERCGDYANEDGRRADNAQRAYSHFHH